MPFGGFGKVIMLLGIVIFLLGGLMTLAGKIPWLGNLPGDIHIQRKNFHFYFPLGTSVLVSVLLSLLLSLFFRR